MLDYFHIWQVWAGGKPTQHLVLWGLEVLWWGRIGKLLEFFGALTVILDLIGPERLRSWGRALNSNRFAGARRSLQKALADNSEKAISISRFTPSTPIIDVRRPSAADARVLEAWFKEAHEKSQLAERELGEERWRIQQTERSFKITIAIVSIIGLGGYIIAMERYSPFVAILFGLGTFLIVGLGVILKPILTLGLALITLVPNLVLLLTGIAIDSFLIRPIAAVLEATHPGLLIKWAGVVTFVVGFHFDLLAS